MFGGEIGFCVGESRGRGIPPARSLLQTSQADRLQVARHLADDRPRPGRLGVEHQVPDVHAGRLEDLRVRHCLDRDGCVSGLIRLHEELVDQTSERN